MKQGKDENTIATCLQLGLLMPSAKDYQWQDYLEAMRQLCIYNASEIVMLIVGEDQFIDQNAPLLCLKVTISS